MGGFLIRRFACLLTFGAALAALLDGSHALARTLDQIQRLGVISVCAPPRALPFATREGQQHGFEIDLAQAVAQRLGVVLKTGWITQTSQIRSVDCDLLMDTIVDSQALDDAHLAVSRPYMRTGVALALPGGRDDVTRLADLPADARVGVQVGSVTQTVLGMHGHRTVPFGYESDMLDALAAGDIDAAAVTPMSAGWYNHEHEGQAFRLVYLDRDVPELGWNVAIGMRRPDKALRGEIDRILQDMLEAGDIQRIYAAYGIDHRMPGQQAQQP
jgi:polar amino acid transport system substrate-binding protein